MTTFHIITIFPEIFDSYFNESILKRAQKQGQVGIKIYNLRDFADDKHKTVDDTPYGGGPGMVLKVEPIWRCVQAIKSKVKSEKLKVVLTSAKGEEYNQRKAEDFRRYSDIIIICGRYEGVDERVAEHIADEEISIGRYILTGGELPAMIIADSVTRLLPGVLGNEDSLSDSEAGPHDLKFRRSHPQYTKPEEFKGWKAPKVLLSGDHSKIEQWRKGQ